MGSADKLKREHEMIQIRTMRFDNKMTDLQISKRLNISLRTVQRYKQLMYKRDKEVLKERLADNIAHEVVSVMDLLNETIVNMQKIAGSSATPLERIEAEKMKLQCANDKINLLTKGPLILSHVVSMPLMSKYGLDETKGKELEYNVKIQEPGSEIQE